jgi:drug/metabolite transporter (DMT)-like permease
MSTDSGEKRLAYLAWSAVCLIWGTTYLGIRICLETMPPLLMGGLRWTLAGSILLASLVARGVTMPPAGRWPHLALLAFLLIVLGNGGVVLAEQWVPSGLTAVIVATTPFWMVGLDAIMPNSEGLTARRIGGLLVGFAGIVLLVWPELALPGGGGRNFVLGLAALQVAEIGWALGSLYSKRRGRDENPLVTATFQMIFGGAMLLAGATARGEWQQLSFNTRTAASFAYLSTVGSIGGFVAYLYALKHLPVSTVSLYAYINPVIAVLLGVLVLSEPFDSRVVVAAVLVLVGVAIVRT